MSEQPTPVGGLPVTHTHSPEDVDGAWNSGHHTLGQGSTQSAPGNHLHDYLGVTITGAKTGASALQLSMLAALIQLGCTDATT